MKQIESFALGELCICINYFKNIRFLPGVNLVDDESYSDLNEHPAFIKYLKSGKLSEINIDETDFTIDPDTNITIIETDGEVVPIQNITINNQSAPIAKVGIMISPAQAKKAGLNTEIANRISTYAPPTGWISAQQIRDKLDLDANVDLSKLPFPDSTEQKI